MEKMSIIFYVLTIFGALLVPTYAQISENSTNVNTSTNPVSDEMSSQTTVSKETTENIWNITEDFSLSPEPSTEGPPKDNVTTDSKATNATKGETTTKSATEKKSTTKAAPSPSTKGKTEKESATTPAPDTNGITTSPVEPVPDPDGKTEDPKVSSSVYIIIILVVICLIIFCIIVFCVYKGDRRRYSVDIHAKNEDAQIPLALVEPELCDVSPKDMKTFASAEESSPTGTGEKTEEEKAPNEADQQDTKNPGETSTTETSAEKPAEPKSLDVSEEDATPSTKTSVETLNDGLNENNSNNNAVHDLNVCFIDICLND